MEIFIIFWYISGKINNIFSKLVDENNDIRFIFLNIGFFNKCKFNIGCFIFSFMIINNVMNIFLVILVFIIFGEIYFFDGFWLSVYMSIVNFGVDKIKLSELKWLVDFLICFVKNRSLNSNVMILNGRLI